MGTDWSTIRVVKTWNVAQVSEILNVSGGILYRWLRAGALPRFIGTNAKHRYRMLTQKDLGLLAVFQELHRKLHVSLQQAAMATSMVGAIWDGRELPACDILLTPGGHVFMGRSLYTEDGEEIGAPTLGYHTVNVVELVMRAWDRARELEAVRND